MSPSHVVLDAAAQDLLQSPAAADPAHHTDDGALMTQDADIDENVLNPDPGIVTVWSDIGCPWASLALHTLRATAKERGADVLIDHRAFALELFNRMPTPKTIVDAEVVIIAGWFPELSWKLWDAPEHTFPVTTLPALEAVQAAKDPAVGGLAGSDELDAALREAFYVHSKCISVHSMILEVAQSCPHVDHEALAAALARGSGRAEVYEQRHVAQRTEVRGSPHVFAASGVKLHNPGVEYQWTGRPQVVGGRGFPRLDGYRPEWAGELLDQLSGRG